MGGGPRIAADTQNGAGPAAAKSKTNIKTNGCRLDENRRAAATQATPELQSQPRAPLASVAAALAHRLKIFAGRGFSRDIIAMQPSGFSR